MLSLDKAKENDCKVSFKAYVNSEVFVAEMRNWCTLKQMLWLLFVLITIANGTYSLISK